MTRIRQKIPNALTVFRLFLAMIFYFIPYGYQLAVVIIAGLSDALDGLLARRWDARSEFGRILDPIADRLFVAVMAVTFLVDARLTVIQLLLIGLRDLVVVLGSVAIAVARRWSEFSRIEARLPGKIATVAQFLFMGSVLLLGQAIWVLVAITAMASAVAAIDYTRSYFQKGRVPVEA